MKSQRPARKQRRAAQLALRKRLKKQARRVPLQEDRRGSVIVVVIALLSALMFLGFVFFSLSSQENENAEYFLEASKKIEPLEFDPNDVFDCFLEQLILGAPDHKYNSVFWGGRISLLPTMYGTDASPFNGEGTNAIWNIANARPEVDRDNDGTPDIDQRPLWINVGPGAVLDPATGQPYPPGTDAKQFHLFRDDGNPATFTADMPNPDVNYLYPDHNFPMLSYVGFTSNGTGVIIPAGHRPALLRNRGTGGWYTDPATLPYVLRPHREKRAVAEDGRISSLRRYQGAFFTSQPDPMEGVWDQSGSWNYDGDPTGRGAGVFKDSVILDCEFPIQTDFTTGQQFVPLVTAFIVDAESLINLNYAGNDSENLVRPAGRTLTNMPPNVFLTRSNLGVSRSEINPGWALLTDPSGASAADQQPYMDYFNAMWPVTPVQMANMELWSLLHGRAEITGPVATQAYPGRWGEPALVTSAWNGGGSVTAFPWAGESAIDDNNNLLAGNVPPPQWPFYNPHPFDAYGVGNITGSSAYLRNLPAPNGSQGKLTFPGYDQYSQNNLPYPNYFGSNLMQNFDNGGFLDEPEEMEADPRFSPNFDNPFPASASAVLQMTRTDLTQLGTSSILEDLAPYTFQNATDEEQIRHRFTTHSFKMLAHGKTYAPFDGRRSWEWKDFDGDGLRDFPPTMGVQTQPFRPETFELLFAEARDVSLRKLQRKLSVNGVVDRVFNGSQQNGYLRIRPLTDHPLGLSTAAPIGNLGLTDPSQINSPQAREYFARFDRQRLCRDIYTLLYLFGGSVDGLDYLLTSNASPRPAGTPPSLTAAPYTEDECREMAQFAVNLVDQMDQDDVITMFQYDTNLQDGWQANDYPYPPDHRASPTNPDPPDIAANYVYGVEEQQLCFSEAHAIYAEAVDDEDSSSSPKDKIDFAGTEWDDMTDHHFLFFELENVSARQVTFNNEAWQVVVRPLQRSAGTPTDTGTVAGEERRLTFTAQAPAVGVGNDSRLSVGTVGNEGGTVPVFPAGSFPQTAPADGTEPGPSRFMVDPQFRLGAATPERISPAMPVVFDNSANDDNYIDLLREWTQYEIYEDAPLVSDEFDGNKVTNSQASPSGAQLLKFNGTQDPAANDYQVELVLRRRLNPYRQPPIHQDATDPNFADYEQATLDNPWVVVDRFQVPLTRFFLQDDSVTGTEIVDALDGSQLSDPDSLQSLERGEPLYADPDPNQNATQAANYDSTDHRANTIGEENDNAPSGAYLLWHPHYNRAFASLAEVFNVPLFGPDRLYGPDQDKNTPVPPSDWRGLTVKLGDNTTNGLRLTGEETVSSLATTFGKRVLNPSGVGVTSDPMTRTIEPANRWHRILELLEAPKTTGQTLGRVFVPPGQQPPQTPRYRDGGPINLNTIKESVILAGILDDQRVTRVPNLGEGTLPTTGTNAPLWDQSGNSTGGPTSYNWWRVFQNARDGRLDYNNDGNPDTNPPVFRDPINNAVGAIPGVPGISRPFRPLEYSAGGASSIQETVLRSNSVDDIREANLGMGTKIQKRQLFELGTWQQVAEPGVDQDYAFKHRLLGKVMNHTTTQSNTFIVFLQVDYFEAIETPDPALGGQTVVQIGQKMATSPGFRGVFVIDRTLAPELLSSEDIPNRDPNSPNPAKTFSFSPNFDWRSLIVHRQRLN